MRQIKKGPLRVAFPLMSIFMLLSGCNGSKDITYEDGIYAAKSTEDDEGAYGEVTLTIAAGKIVDCEYVTWQKDGTIRDEDYGKINGEIANQAYYEKAQHAVRATLQYAQELVAVQQLEDVDAISGATISYGQFQEAVNSALKEAKTEPLTTAS